MLSEIPHGKIESIDFSEALKMEGVEGYFDSRHLEYLDPRFKPVDDDKEKVFAHGKVRCVGEIIGIVVAKTQELADIASKKVKVNYLPLPSVVSIEDAIEKKSFFPYDHKIVSGDPENEFLRAKSSQDSFYMEGSLKEGGQEHFYLEPHAILCLPVDHDEMVVYSCTQCITKSQNAVAGIFFSFFFFVFCLFFDQNFLF